MASPEDKQKHSRRRKNHIQRDLYKKFKEKDHSIPVDKKEKYPLKVRNIEIESYDDDCI